MILKFIGLQKIIDQLFDDNWTAIWPLENLQKRSETHARHLSKNHLISIADNRQHHSLGTG
jgi:hypothetical protein